MCELEMAYCIGVAEPDSLNVNTHVTNTTDEERIITTIRKEFACAPKPSSRSWICSDLSTTSQQPMVTLDAKTWISPGRRLDTCGRSEVEF